MTEEKKAIPTGIDDMKKGWLVACKHIIVKTYKATIHGEEVVVKRYASAEEVVENKTTFPS